MDQKELARISKALSDPTRLRIVEEDFFQQGDVLRPGCQEMRAHPGHDFASS